jgi:hypothetical protein
MCSWRGCGKRRASVRGAGIDTGGHAVCRNVVVLSAGFRRSKMERHSHGRSHGLQRAHEFRRLQNPSAMFEELIESADAQPQVAESPDRGLDAQTPSGEEAERAARLSD